jgi:hypothetical protein
MTYAHDYDCEYVEVCASHKECCIEILHASVNPQFANTVNFKTDSPDPTLLHDERAKQQFHVMSSCVRVVIGFGVRRASWGTPGRNY